MADLGHARTLPQAKIAACAADSHCELSKQVCAGIRPARGAGAVPRYNVAPTQTVAAVRFDAQGGRRHDMLSWGLVPSWSKDTSAASKMINARAETVAEKPVYRAAFKRGRCLIVADGFYEWKRVGTKKQPYLIGLKDRSPFAFAGLSEHWQKSGQIVDSCAIITTGPNELMQGIHDRMPVILPPSAYDLWLDPEFQSRDKLLSLLQPYPASE